MRSLRARHPNPKWIPTAYLKEKWRNWHVPTYPARSGYQTAHGDDVSYDPGSTTVASTQEVSSTRNPSAAARLASRSNRGARQSSQNQTNVDRNTSIRSVMTLPAYKAEAREGEQVLGREGERDGIDVVLEMRSAEEEEELRNREMEQLYQIRLLRRQWNADREQRRARRREARARGDVAALQQLREEATAAQDNNEIDELRRMLEDIKSERDGRASVVNYGNVGVARHDGTRIRANSMESEQVGLLSDAETMGQGSPGLGGPQPGRNRTSSLMTWSTGEGQGHRRTSSALSVEVDFPSPGVTRSRANSAATSRDPSPGSRRVSDAPVVEVDLGDEMPPHSPPGYEDAPTDRSGANTPMPSEPPPGYVSREPSQANRTSTGLGISIAEEDDTASRRSSRGVGGVPQLPSLRLARLPQIVVEPSPTR